MPRVPAALFWSVVMAVAALLPVLGTPVVRGPAAAWLALTDASSPTPDRRAA